MAKFSDRFPKGMEPNFTWGGNGPNVGDLRVHMTHYRDGSVRSVSCWELQPDELQEVIRSGKVYLSVYGNHPPVYVGSALNFDLTERDEPTELAKQLEQAREAEVWFHPEINEFVNDLLENAPGDYDDDAAASSIAVKYVRELERESERLNAWLETLRNQVQADAPAELKVRRLSWMISDALQNGADEEPERGLIDDDRR
jgi:hypothetical protein